VLAPLLGHPLRGLALRARGIPREMADSRVLATARHIHICLRVAVLRYSPHFRGFRSASAQNKAAQCILGNWANGTCVRLSLRGKARLLPRAASTVRSAILRRRDTAFSSRARPLAHHANCHRAVPLRTPLATAFGGSLRSGDTIPHTCAISPTFRCGAFFFVASALADLSSARLTAHGNRPANPLLTVD